MHGGLQPSGAPNRDYGFRMSQDGRNARCLPRRLETFLCAARGGVCSAERTASSYRAPKPQQERLGVGAAPPDY